MELYHNIISLDRYFDSIPNDRKVIVNELDYFKQDDIDFLKSKVRTTIKNDIISLTPQCACGELTGKYLENELCDICSTPVTSYFADYRPIVWLQRLEGVAPFLSPYFITLLDTTLNLSRSLTRWFGDSRYNPPYKTKKDESIFKAIQEMPNFTRSYSWFIDNLPLVLDTIINNHPSNDKSKMMDILTIKEVFIEKKDILLSNVIPILHRKFVIIEKTSKGNYISSPVTQVMNITLPFTKDMEQESIKKREAITAKALQLIADMEFSVVKAMLSTKPGLSRKQIFGMRSHFSSRAVVVPIIGKHDYDELHLPWGVGVTMMRPHVLNILINRFNMSYREANTRLFSAVTRYDEYISKAFDILVAESPGGIPITLNRNPSQNSASLLRLRVSKIKKDPRDNTFALSILVLVYSNGDVDGDALQLSLLLDNYMGDMFNVLKPEVNVTAVSNKPGNIFKKTGLMETTVSTIGSRISEERKKYNLA